MKTFTKTIEVFAVLIASTCGTKIIDDEKKEHDLGNEFATRNNYKPGQMLIFDLAGNPIDYMSKERFKVEYDAVKAKKK